jgi:hypothetical protein
MSALDALARSPDRRASRGRDGDDSELASVYHTQQKRAPAERTRRERMTQTVTLPAWLLAIIVLFAAWAVLDRLLYDPRVQAAVEGEAQAENVARAVIMARVEVYAREIGQVIPAWPVALVACVLLRHPGRDFSELELKFDVFALIRRLEGRVMTTRAHFK